MNTENIDEVQETAEEFFGRICSEVYSCVEDMYYFINLAIPFIN
jgi:hypothetical protein